MLPRFLVQRHFQTHPNIIFKKKKNILSWLYPHCISIFVGSTPIYILAGKNHEKKTHITWWLIRTDVNCIMLHPWFCQGDRGIVKQGSATYHWGELTYVLGGMKSNHVNCPGTMLLPSGYYIGLRTENLPGFIGKSPFLSSSITTIVDVFQL